MATPNLTPRDSRRQPNRDDQTSLGVVRRADLAAVRPDGSRGDGETEPDATGGAVAGLLDTIEGLEDTNELIVADARPVIANAHDHDVVIDGETHIDRRTGLGVVHGVANHVVKGAAQELPAMTDPTFLLGTEEHLGSLCCRFETGVRHHLGEKGAETEQDCLSTVCAGLQTLEKQELTDELIESLGLEFDAIEGLRRRLTGFGSRQLKGHRQPRQRRAKLMRHIPEQTLLGAHEGLDTFGHGVEIARQLTDLVSPGRHIIFDSGAEVSRAQISCRPTQWR